MKIFFLIGFLMLAQLTSCKSKQDEKKVSQQSAMKDSVSANTKDNVDSSQTGSKKLKPVFGYRFIISGDFNGDGKPEKLIEHFFSAIKNKETNKFYDSADYDELVSLTIKKDPISFLSSDNNLIDTLHISSGDQLLGLSYLKNEGDLNADGTDEISYVINWADWSNLNTWHIVTFKNNKWQELYSFAIWDWQLPDLPGTFNQYGLFGLEDKVINTTNDSANAELEKELNNFKGLVQKVSTNKVQIIFRNDDGEEDTSIVQLKEVR